MNIALFFDCPMDAGRGIYRYVNKLFSTVYSLYPDINIYLVLAADGNYKHKSVNLSYLGFKYKIISPDKASLFKNNIDYLLFCFNGYGVNGEDLRTPNLQIVTMLHDLIDVLADDNDNEEIATKITQKNISFQKIYQEMVDNSDIVLTVSEYSKNDILKYLDVPHYKYVDFIYAAPMLNKNYPKLNKPNITEPYFLYNGGYCARKGILQLVYNFLDLKLKNKLKSKLVLTGKHGLKHRYFMWNLINYGVKKGYIILNGYVNDKELIGLYKNAQAMIYPSSYEGFGVPLVEAMQVGCPIITCKNSSIAEVCGEGNVYYIDKYNSDDFQQALLFFENENYASKKQKLINNSYENVKRFSWEESAHKLVGVLRKNKHNTYVNKLSQLKSLLLEKKQLISDIKKLTKHTSIT